MKLSRRSTSLTLAALASCVALTVAVGGCAFPKAGSLTLAQPGGIGAVRVHFVLCPPGKNLGECGTNGADETIQYLVGFAVPPGSSPPESFTAVPVGGGSPVVFRRSSEVAPEITAASASQQAALAKASTPKEKEEAAKFRALIGNAWPPSGTEGIGYLSDPVAEKENQAVERNVDTEFGIPTLAGGKPFAGPFGVAIAFGLRTVSSTEPAGRAVHCLRIEGEVKPQESEAFCSGGILESQLATSDLRIEPPKKPVVAFVGGKGAVPFSLNFGGPAPAPSVSLSAATSAKGAKAKVAGKGKVTVSLPRKVKPGTYTVTLTAKTPQGGTTSGVAKLKVTKPKIKFGGLRPNQGNGTAILPVRVPGAGKLKISGAGISTVTKKAKKATGLKLTISPTGAAASRLARAGSLRVKIKATFKPSSGISVSKTKTVVLEQR